MNSDFRITSEQIQQQGKPITTVFIVRGWLDAQSEENLVTAAQEVFNAGTRYLIVNLEDVNMLTSIGIRALQKVNKLFTPQDNNSSIGLRLCNASPNVYEVLKITGFLKLLPVYESLEAALESFN